MNTNNKDTELMTSLKNRIKAKINILNLKELKIIDENIDELFANKFNKAKENIEVLFEIDIKYLNRPVIVKNNNKFSDVPKKINFIKNACKKFIEDYENKNIN